MALLSLSSKSKDISGQMAESVRLTFLHGLNSLKGLGSMESYDTAEDVR